MIETFLTAFDPSDLPGTSIDPLGFERGYLFLADKILPGLTNVASRQHVLLSIERILWLCRHHTAASITLAELANDPVMLVVKTNLPARVQRLLDILDHGTMPGFRENLDRLSDVRRFLEAASGAVQDNSAFVEAVITRHADVQHGKFDRGRRKMPWLERINSRIQLTMTRSGGMNREAADPAHINPHPYRLRAADAFISASTKGMAS